MRVGKFLFPPVTIYHFHCTDSEVTDDQWEVREMVALALTSRPVADRCLFICTHSNCTKTYVYISSAHV